jgi:hypothetical protein
MQIYWTLKQIVRVHIHIPIYIYLSLFVFPVAPILEHRESVKRFVSLQFLNPKTVCRTPWTENQPVARPLPTQDNTNRINADIHALSGLQTHDPSVRVSEDISCLRPRGHCDRPYTYHRALIPYANQWTIWKLHFWFNLFSELSFQDYILLTLISHDDFSILTLIN